MFIYGEIFSILVSKAGAYQSGEPHLTQTHCASMKKHARDKCSSLFQPKFIDDEKSLFILIPRGQEFTLAADDSVSRNGGVDGGLGPDTEGRMADRFELKRFIISLKFSLLLMQRSRLLALEFSIFLNFHLL